MHHSSTLRALLALSACFFLLLVSGTFAFAQTVPADMTPSMGSGQAPPEMTTPEATTSTMEETAPSSEDMTPEMPAGPSISNVSVTDITDTSARIDVRSDEMAQGYVEYGTTEQYGASTPLSSEFTTSPSFVLEELTPDTLYHYRVVVIDSAGSAAITGDETFTTLAPPPTEPEEPPVEEISASTTATSTPPASESSEEATTSETATASATSSEQSSPEATTAETVAPTYPVISNVSISSVSTSTATISWTTSKPATSDIQYGTSTSYRFSSGEDTTLNTSHSKTMTELAPATLYHFRVIAADAEGNTALSKDRTFTTLGLSSSASASSSAAISMGTNSASSSEEILASIVEEGAVVAMNFTGSGGLPVVPHHPLLLTVTPLDDQVAFDWRKDAGIKNGTINTVIVRKEGTSPVESRIDGDIIYDGPSTTFTDTDVENGVEYHYALYSYDTYGRFTPAARFKIIPQAGEEQVDIPAAEIATSTPAVITRDLSQGSQGNDVWHLQAHLASNGYYSEALLTGYFGPLTRSAVIRYQTLNSISPAAGYVGPITREMLGQ